MQRSVTCVRIHPRGNISCVEIWPFIVNDLFMCTANLTETRILSHVAPGARRA